MQKSFIQKKKKKTFPPSEFSLGISLFQFGILKKKILCYGSMHCDCEIIIFHSVMIFDHL